MTPDFSALDGTGIEHMVGGLLTIVLTGAVAALIISAICWAYGHTDGNWQLTVKGKYGVVISVGVAGLAGAGVAYINWLIALGEQL
jgi:drug/metabolite transporter (DMT)-like permease